jgi:hypothetical protein
LLHESAQAADTQTISFQKPDDPGPEPFTEPADVSGTEEVDLPTSGPYGGTGSDKVCDRDRLIRYLEENPDRMREWARVLGVEPSFKAVSKYIAKLHPVTCKGCPPNYKPPQQCKLYTKRISYKRTTYTEDYYENEEYDEVFVDASRSGPYEDCYTAYPDPPVVKVVRVYRQPVEPEPEQAPDPPAQDTGLNCDNPRSQEEYERCHPPQEEPPATETTPPPTETTPPTDGRDPNYDCPDQPPAHPGEDYLRNCG